MKTRLLQRQQLKQQQQQQQQQQQPTKTPWKFLTLKLRRGSSTIDGFDAVAVGNGGDAAGANSFDLLGRL